MPGKRGIAKSLPGYYSPGEAMRRIGISDRNMFRSFVTSGRLTAYHPGEKKTAMYLKEQVDQLADEIALLLKNATKKSLEIRPAKVEDTPGIVDVLAIMGWPTATAEQRASWYAVNPFIDFVVTFQGKVAGYINACPYTPEALEDIMSGRRRAWDMQPSDIQPYKEGETYTLYVGIAVKQNIFNHTILASRLIAGFIAFLKGLAQQGIIIHRLYAVSAEKDGQDLCDDLGFIEQEAQLGDLFPRYVLDLQTSDSHFARRYRESISQ